MTPFLSRVYDCKHRFQKEHGIEPTQLFLGPLEYLQLREYVAHLEARGLIYRENDAERAIREYKDTIAGMTIIHLATDGMLAGITTS